MALISLHSHIHTHISCFSTGYKGAAESGVTVNLKQRDCAIIKFLNEIRKSK